MSRSGVAGAKSTARNIRRLPSTIRTPVSQASRYALQPILAASKVNLRANDSVKRGVLIRNMKIRQKPGRRRSLVDTVVTATGKAIPIAHLVEFGTEPHWQPKRGVMHPGADPKPFLTPAYVDHEDEAIKRFGKNVGPRIEAQAARLGRRK